MSNYQDQMMSLLQRAYDEGLAKASQSSPSQPTPADDIPVHNIVNPIVVNKQIYQ